MEATIRQALHDLEAQRHIQILYACEAGSRAWGFESPDSDYDIRFIYVRPASAYLALDVPRDVIELPIVDDLDISGWDIYKALRLLRKSNPSVIEWLYSPLIYLEASPAIADMRRLARSAIAPRAPLYYHYLHMAASNYRQYIEGCDQVLLKKYLYVIRPLIMLLYQEQHDYEMPSTVNFFDTLASVALPGDVRDHIDELVKRKMAEDEIGRGSHDTVLDNFIDLHLERGKTLKIGDRYDSRSMRSATSTILSQILGYDTIISDVAPDDGMPSEE